MADVRLLAHCIFETARHSFWSVGSSELLLDDWNEVIEHSEFQTMVRECLTSSVSTIDFHWIKDTFGDDLHEFSSWPSVKALFYCLLAEYELDDRVVQDFVAKYCFDPLLDDVAAYLDDRQTCLGA